MAVGRIEQRDRQLWNHTSAILEKLHNVNCIKESDLVAQGQLNPWTTKGAAGSRATLDKTDIDATTLEGKKMFREAFRRFEK